MTRFGDFFNFGGKFLRPFATINLPKSSTLLGNFCYGLKIYHFSGDIILGNFYRHLAIFIWSHWATTATAKRRIWKKNSEKFSQLRDDHFCFCCSTLTRIRRLLVGKKRKSYFCASKLNKERERERGGGKKTEKSVLVIFDMQQ